MARTLRAEIDQLARSGTPMSVRKGELLLREGEIAEHAFLVRAGALRSFTTPNARDVTFQFFVEGSLVSSFESFRTRRPSRFSVEAIEDGEVVRLTRAELGQFARGKTPDAIDQRALDPLAIEFARRLNESDHLVLVFPIWWELMPALMKGFIDKVIFPGLFYRYERSGLGMTKLSPSLRGVTMVTTMNTPSFLYRWVFGGAIRFAVLRGVFWKLGVRSRTWLNFAMVKEAPAAKRAAWLAQVRTRFERLSA